MPLCLLCHGAVSTHYQKYALFYFLLSGSKSLQTNNVPTWNESRVFSFKLLSDNFTILFTVIWLFRHRADQEIIIRKRRLAKELDINIKIKPRNLIYQNNPAFQGPAQQLTVPWLPNEQRKLIVLFEINSPRYVWKRPRKRKYIPRKLAFV